MQGASLPLALVSTRFLVPSRCFAKCITAFAPSHMQIGTLLDKTSPPEDRRIAICVVDDLLEHSPLGRAKHFDAVSHGVHKAERGWPGRVLDRGAED